jgi:hypothetical protein
MVSGIGPVSATGVPRFLQSFVFKGFSIFVNRLESNLCGVCVKDVILNSLQ